MIRAVAVRVIRFPSEAAVALSTIAAAAAGRPWLRSQRHTSPPTSPQSALQSPELLRRLPGSFKSSRPVTAGPNEHHSSSHSPDGRRAVSPSGRKVRPGSVKKSQNNSRPDSGEVVPTSMDERTPSPQPRAGSTDDDGTVNSAEEGNDDLSTGARDEGPDGYVTIGGAFEVQLMALPAAAKLVSGYWCMCAF